jgi:hypothetical protein
VLPNDVVLGGPTVITLALQPFSPKSIVGYFSNFESSHHAPRCITARQTSEHDAFNALPGEEWKVIAICHSAWVWTPIGVLSY